MVKVVLAGCGAMSSVWFEAIAKIPEVELVGLVDIDLARAQACAKKYNLSGIGIGTDLKAILSSTKPEAVFDVVVPQARKELVLSAFAHGCHVLTEKPMAASLEEARDILESAKQHNRIHAVVQNRRYLGNVRRIRRFLDSGVLGKLTSVHADFFIAPHFGGFREAMEHVLLVDMAIHTFDAARYMIQASPKAVFCREWDPINSWYKSGSSAFATFDFDSGTVFNYRGSWCASGMKTSWESSWRFVCERGTLLWDGFEAITAERATAQRDGIFEVMESVEIPPLSPADRVGGHEGIIRDFVAAIADGRQPETSGNDNIKSLAMVFGAVESARLGNTVPIDLQETA